MNELDELTPPKNLGEKCFCGMEATHKIAEVVLDGDPLPNRHELTGFVCCEHFNMLFGYCGHSVKEEELGISSLAYRLKNALIKDLSKNEQNLDEPYVYSVGRWMTRREMASEVRNETDWGIELLGKMVRLAIEIARNSAKREGRE